MIARTSHPSRPVAPFQSPSSLSPTRHELVAENTSRQAPPTAAARSQYRSVVDRPKPGMLEDAPLWELSPKALSFN